jgi:hypothetical protein
MVAARSRAANSRVRADVFPALVAVAPAAPAAPASHAPIDPATTATTYGRVNSAAGHVQVDKCRVVVTLDRVLVFQDAPGGPSLIFSERIASYTPPPSQRTLTIRTQATPREATITTDSGKTLAFRRATGCGCGSRLRSFDPLAAYEAASASAPAASATPAANQTSPLAASSKDVSE